MTSVLVSKTEWVPSFARNSPDSRLGVKPADLLAAILLSSRSRPYPRTGSSSQFRLGYQSWLCSRFLNLLSLDMVLSASTTLVLNHLAAGRAV